MFVNILSNAITYSPNSGVIEINTSVYKKDIIKISIINDEPGIPHEQQELIFEKFAQGKKAGNNIGHSSGLGLAFCKMAIEAHGGKIGVVSKTEAGVEFWFTLPDSNCVENMEDEIIEFDSMEMTLSKLDEEYLSPFVLDLKQHELFEVSAIKSILNRIENRNQAIDYWMNELENAVFAGDIKTYKKLLEF